MVVGLICNGPHTGQQGTQPLPRPDFPHFGGLLRGEIWGIGVKFSFFPMDNPAPTPTIQPSPRNHEHMFLLRRFFGSAGAARRGDPFQVQRPAFQPVKLGPGAKKT